MANQQVRMGLVPVNLRPQDVVTLAKSTSSTYSLFINSPVYVSAGQVLASTTTGDCTGTVIALYDSNGAPASCLPAASAGTVTLSFRANQQYKVTVSGTQLAANNADIGKTYDMTAEAGTDVSTTTLGSTYSTRQIDGATEHASNGFLTAGKIVPVANNDGGVTGVEIFCTITAANYVPCGM